MTGAGWQLTNEAVVACHVEPLLAGFHGVVELQRLACPELALRVEDCVLRLDLLVGVLVGLVVLPLLRLGPVPLAALRLRDDGDGEGAVGTVLVRDGTVGMTSGAIRGRARALLGLGTHRRAGFGQRACVLSRAKSRERRAFRGIFRAGRLVAFQGAATACRRAAASLWVEGVRETGAANDATGRCVGVMLIASASVGINLSVCKHKRPPDRVPEVTQGRFLQRRRRALVKSGEQRDKVGFRYAPNLVDDSNGSSLRVWQK